MVAMTIAAAATTAAATRAEGLRKIHPAESSLVASTLEAKFQAVLIPVEMRTTESYKGEKMVAR